MIIDFKKYSSIKIGSSFEVELLNEFCDFDGFIIGGANNILVSNSPKKLALLGKNFDFIELLEQDKYSQTLKIGCATKAITLYHYAKKQNLKGFEFLAQLPGLLGGLLKMNAGLKQECISKNLQSIKVKDKSLNKEEIGFEYRFCPLKEIMFEAIFKLDFGFDYALDKVLSKARANQPRGASFGSIFKNPKNDYAARLIEAVGLKGYTKGDACISEKHANFLINKKNACFEDALFLIELIEKKVYEAFGISLEREVIII